MEKLVSVERTLPYPVGKVFALWLRPEAFAEWFLPDPGVKLGRVKLDPWIGGEFLIEMIVGDQTLPHTGVYRKIVPEKEIVFTWSSSMTGDTESVVEVNFEAQGSSTVVRLTHHGLESAESREAHGAGWTNILGGMAPFLSRTEQA